MSGDATTTCSTEISSQQLSRASENRGGIEVVDEVYLIDSGRKPVWVYPLKLEGRMYPDLPQFREYFSEQYYANYKQ